MYDVYMTWLCHSHDIMGKRQVRGSETTLNYRAEIIPVTAVNITRQKLGRLGEYP